ncbi:hypothetical protein [Enterococcus casseliflavus]|uniref:hypothetical protein n=1 Tax=Enterococcus casseliflavus TaxID=37734 RepID=UPI002954B0E0|nr:hypothetical protein [Enterococcus casseliflavus]MDV7737409.1 hypothetical protein [Enterococcus casseliflavus]
MITEIFKSKVNLEIKKMITSIRLNDEVIVSEFSSASEGATLLIEFEVPEQILILRKLEFYDGEALLSECKVYVPINGNTLFKYRIEVK